MFCFFKYIYFTTTQKTYISLACVYICVSDACKQSNTTVIVYVHLLEESAPLSSTKQYSTLCQPATAHSRHFARGKIREFTVQ